MKVYISEKENGITQIDSLVVKIGRKSIAFFEGYGRLTLMSVKALWAFRKIPEYIPQIIEQFIYIGRRSLFLVITTSIFVGLALGVQIGTQMSPSTPPWVEGGLILRSILLEMGPIVLGLILSGRVASGIASELGAMKVTEQIDALRVLAIDPVEYLVMPRMVAAIVAIPVLLVFSDTVGVLSGFLSSHFTIHLTWEGFIKGMRHVFNERDVYTSLIKALIFGQVIILFGSYFGLNSGRGAKGVGRATNRASVELNRTLSHLNQGKGTLGKLMVEDSLYQNLNRSIQHLDSLILDIKKHPERYFKVKVL